MEALLAPPTPQPPSEEKRVRRRLWKVLIIVVIVLGVAGLAAVVYGCVTLFDPGDASRESDAVLVARFRNHRAEFRELLELAWAKDGRGPNGKWLRAGAKKPRLTPRQRRRYRQLKKLLGIEYGIDVYGGKVDFNTALWGIVSSGWGQGYMWTKKAPSPLVDDTHRLIASSNTVYRRLGGHWYLFYDTW